MWYIFFKALNYTGLITTKLAVETNAKRHVFLPLQSSDGGPCVAHGGKRAYCAPGGDFSLKVVSVKCDSTGPPVVLSVGLSACGVPCMGVQCDWAQDREFLLREPINSRLDGARLFGRASRWHDRCARPAWSSSALASTSCEPVP